MSNTTSSIEYPPEQYPLRIKNWDKFQRYKFRNPPWIKLHISILQSEDWVTLGDSSRLLMITLLLIASQHDGFLPKVILNPDYLKRIAHFSRKPKLKPLIDCGFLIEMHTDAHRCAQTRTNALQSTDTDTEKKDNNQEEAPEKKSREVKTYAFESGVIRLSQKDFDSWEASFSYLDLRAELEGAREWAESLGPKWFFPVSKLLAKKNREAKLRLDAGPVVAPTFKWPSKIEGII